MHDGYKLLTKKRLLEAIRAIKLTMHNFIQWFLAAAVGALLGAFALEYLYRENEIEVVFWRWMQFIACYGAGGLALTVLAAIREKRRKGE